MTDPNTPNEPSAAPVPPAAEPTAAPAEYGYAAPPAAPAYAAAPPAPYGAPAVASVPGKTLGIVAFILSFFVQLVALVLGIVALVQSRKAGQKNGFALAAIIISAVLMVIGVIVAIVVIAVVVGGIAAACGDLGPGIHYLDNGTTITCN